MIISKKKMKTCKNYDIIEKWEKIVNHHRKPTDYDKLMSDFLASDKSKEYKRSILSLLGTDHGRHSCNTQEEEEDIREIVVNINELPRTRKVELNEIAKNLDIKYYTTTVKPILIKQIKEKIKNSKRYICKEE